MTDEPTARVWVRGRWRLPDGREITRTAKREVAAAPDDMERRLVVLHDFLEELRATGLDLPEGRGELIELLGTLTD